MTVVRRFVLLGQREIAWKVTVENFLGNLRAPEYIQLDNKLLSAYKTIKCKRSLKIYFLHSHLDFFLLLSGNSACLSGQTRTKIVQKCLHSAKTPPIRNI